MPSAAAPNPSVIGTPAVAAGDLGTGPGHSASRRAALTVLALSVAIGTWALVTSIAVDRPLSDPEGSFLGPSYLRLPILCAAAVLLDLLPRALWFSRGRLALLPVLMRERLREHWTRERVLLVLLGIASFYVIYVCYRNLKSFLPLVIDKKYDRELNMVDRLLLFGHEPGPALHDLLGTNVAAHVLSYIYVLFIPMVPILVTVWVVWSRNLSFGWWFITSQGIAWTLGTISYYALPTLGPGLAFPFLYDIAHTDTSDLMNSLMQTRQNVLFGDGQTQGVAGFASLHTGISLLWALMVQHTVANRVVRRIFWVNFGLIVLATVYFGWHYLSDDVAGVALALISFYLGGLASGQSFRRHRPEEPVATDDLLEPQASAGR